MITTTDALTRLADDYQVWWIDLLGEHNHIGGEDATRWLLSRAELKPGARMLDAGAFVGAAARLAAKETGCTAVATDLNLDFLAAGRELEGGDSVRWVTADSRHLPFPDGSFQSVWAMDTYISVREFSRVAAKSGATLCLDCEVPVDGRGGVEAFIDEWAEYGWSLAAHKESSNDATVAWRNAEADMVRRRPYFEQRYGTRPYLGQLDMLMNMVASYERHEEGHGLFVFRR
ncbi:MAG: class I SAM-dependent methyltransferase [Dehalococcoidia bacterium]